MIHLPFSHRGEGGAAAGVGAGQNGVGGRFQDGPPLRCNALYTHFGHSPAPPYGGRAPGMPQGEGQSLRIVRILRIVRTFILWLGFLGVKNPNGTSAKNAESAKNAWRASEREKQIPRPAPSSKTRDSG